MTIPTTVSAATYQSPNFVVSAASVGVAKQIADVAEHCRTAFAREWFDVDPADWEVTCRIRVDEQSSGGHGRMSVETYRGRIDDLEIILTGRLDLIVEYVLPHEVAHVVLAVALDRPLPRWADEGVAMLSESTSQQMRQRMRVEQLATADQMAPLTQLLRRVDYPEDSQGVVNFYAMSFALTDYLVVRGGKRCLMQFIQDGEECGWDESAHRHYGTGIEELEAAWKTSLLASASSPEPAQDASDSSAHARSKAEGALASTIARTGPVIEGR